MTDNATDSKPADVDSATEPAPSPRRRRPGMRDMVLSMLLLGIVVVVLTMLAQGSFNTAGNSGNSRFVPTVDAPAELQAAAAQLPFPLHQPNLPSDWRPNSASVDPTGTGGANHAVRIGWVAPGGQFLQLSQSDAPAPALVRQAAGFAADTPIEAVGHTTVAGTDWTIYPGVRSEQSWAADLGSVRLLITGSGSEEQFRTMAEAVLGGRVVRAGRS